MPTNQQSWAGKAHSTNEEIVATPLWLERTATNSPRSYPWFLLNSTPASCIQIALGHLLEDRPRVIDKLYTQGEWTPGTLYSVTIPCLVGVAREIAWTSVYANTWRKPECFEELMPRTGYIEQKPDPERTGTAIKKEQHSPTQTETSMVGQERFFKWAPKLDKVVEDSMHAPIGTDAWAIQTGKTSITKLSANPT
ncbi:hypothetical protein D6D04_06616 [Aureobasidium pullulans]|nr:hypothetical protein D6D04_06616 [Aureobasidium pullulans]